MTVIKEKRPRNICAHIYTQFFFSCLAKRKENEKRNRMENKYSSHLLNKLQTYKINLKDKKKPTQALSLVQMLTKPNNKIRTWTHYNNNIAEKISISRALNQISVLWMRIIHHIWQIWFQRMISPIKLQFLFYGKLNFYKRLLLSMNIINRK